MTLGKSIVLLLTGLLVGTALLVGGLAYVTTRSSIVELREELLLQVDERVKQRMQAYFDSAEPALEFIDKAVFDDPAYFDDWENRARLLTDYLKTESDIVWLYYADVEKGNMLGVNIDLEGRYVISRISVENGRIAQGFEIAPDDSLRSVILNPDNPNPSPYDPRLRPWFRQAIESEGLVWTPPYGFLSSQVVGITAARAVRDRDGKAVGVLGADLELGRLATFLDSFEVGSTGAAFLLLDGGASVVPASNRGLPFVGELQGALESQLWDFSGLASMETIETNFDYKGTDYIMLAQPIDLPGPTRYYAAVVVPEAEYTGAVTRNAWITLGAGSAILLLAIGLGVWQARRVTDPLAAISEELESIGNLRFRDTGPPVRSKIREVSQFSESVGKMKISLRAFSRYVPRDLVRLLLARGDEAQLGGDLKEVTAVFTDLAGFTSFSESLAPDKAFSELSAFLEVVATHQEKLGGITSSFTGDGTLALFNAPEDLPNHCTKAVLASLEIVDELKRLNVIRRERGEFEFRARFGINTAEVLLGNVGTSERFAYTAIGDGVNLASRLEGLCKLYGTSILAGAACRNQDESEIEWRLIDKISVVGRRQSTLVYEPLGREGEVDAAKLAARDQYEVALDHYFNASLDKALGAFHQLAIQQTDDRATRVMIQRVQKFIHEGLPEGWDGTFAALVK